ncbi:MAG: aminotransferase class I/II-fold pyridoxal phosphate-dependent enzyme [Bacteroidetes bacterium]|nr:MAG: aminotransferase class I/II-fold pyridoxal phosphate-dependent enzyme [Bacteroidota bacterium]
MIIPTADRLQNVPEYYFARKLREIRTRIAAGQDIINLGIGNPDMMPSEPTLKALVKSALEPHNHGYQPYKGAPQLRSAFTDWYLNTYGVSLDPETEVLPLMGSKEGIMHISMAFLNPGDEVLVPDPGYLTYASVTRLIGGVVRPYTLRAEQGWYPDLEALAQQDLSRVKLMWVNYPHMPTGTPATDALFESLIAFGREHQILICHDNPYSLVLNPHPQSLLAYPEAKEGVIELNSLSKSHNMAGWRVGMVAGHPDYLNPILQARSNMDSGMFLPLQLAAAEALRNSYGWHQERNAVYAERRQLVWQLLDTLGCRYEREQVGMFVWARIPEGMAHGEQLSEQLLDEARVFLAPGSIFGEAGHAYVRVSLCTPETRLEEALGRIKAWASAPV